MLNNNRNNDQSWRSRLDELESIPSERQPDKKITWNKLQARLEYKPRSKKKYWYWAAAAILLISFVLPRIIAKKEAPALVKTTQDKYPLTNSTSASASKNAVNNKTAISIKNNEVPHPNNTVKENTAIVKNKIAGVSPQLLTEATTVITIVQAVPDTAVNIVTAVSKKKLAVIHINELEGNNNPTEISNNNNSFRRFIRPSNKDVSVGAPAGNGYNGDHIIIRNVNPQNQD